MQKIKKCDTRGFKREILNVITNMCLLEYKLLVQYMSACLPA